MKAYAEAQYAREMKTKLLRLRETVTLSARSVIIKDDDLDILFFILTLSPLPQWTSGYCSNTLTSSPRYLWFPGLIYFSNSYFFLSVLTPKSSLVISIFIRLFFKLEGLIIFYEYSFSALLQLHTRRAISSLKDQFPNPQLLTSHSHHTLIAPPHNLVSQYLYSTNLKYSVLIIFDSFLSPSYFNNKLSPLLPFFEQTLNNPVVTITGFLYSLATL